MKKCQNKKVHTDITSMLKNNFLSEEQIEKISKFYKIMSDKTRIKILCYLNKNELCVCDICELLNMEQSAISHQLAVLKKYDFVKYRKQGKEVFYMLSDYHIYELINSAQIHINEKENSDGNN